MSRWLLEALESCAERLARAGHCVLGVDFDGTLAPVVSDPDQAQMSPGMKPLLQTLSESPDITLAILSGRERGDLLARVGVPNLFYVGNHGLEISGPGCCFTEPTAVACSAAFQKLGADLTARLHAIPGAAVEDKGVSLCVHYRQAEPTAHEEVRQVVHGVLARTDYPFMLTPGDKAFEIRPRVDWHKGSALNWIRKQVGQPRAVILYLGNVANDEEAFEALADDISVNVAGRTEKARFHLHDPQEVQELLSWLASQLSAVHA